MRRAHSVAKAGDGPAVDSTGSSRYRTIPHPRSTVDDPGAEQHVADHADDAFRLTDLLSPHEPAGVLGTGSGAITALHLLTTHPGRVARLVAHEPPVVELLPNRALCRRWPRSPKA